MSEGAGIRRAPRGHSRHRGTHHLHTVGAAAIAIIAVLAGILFVNLVNGSSGSDDDRPPVAAAGGPAQTASPEAEESATPSPSGEPTDEPDASPSPQAEPTETEAPPQPAEPPPPPAAGGEAGEGTSPRVFAPVIVLNNSRITGLAEAAARKVEAAGFRVERVGNYVSRYNVPATTVFYNSEDEAAARTLLETVPGVERMVPREETQVVVEPGVLILVVTRHFPVDDSSG